MILNRNMPWSPMGEPLNSKLLMDLDAFWDLSLEPGANLAYWLHQDGFDMEYRP